MLPEQTRILLRLDILGVGVTPEKFVRRLEVDGGRHHGRVDKRYALAQSQALAELHKYPSLTHLHLNFIGQRQDDSDAFHDVNESVLLNETKPVLLSLMDKGVRITHFPPEGREDCSE